MRQLEGRTAIVTGAGSGIGLGLARTFARHGMAVALCDIRGDRLDAAPRALQRQTMNARQETPLAPFHGCSGFGRRLGVMALQGKTFGFQARQGDID